MTTDNRTNEPNQNETKSGQGFCFTEAQVEAAAKAMHETRNPWFAAYGAWGAAGFEIKRAFRESARAALVAAQGAATPVNGFYTTAERVQNGADSLHVAPQEPNQNETKSGNNFVSLDPEKVAAMIRDDLRGGEYASAPDELPYAATSRRIARALCEAYTEGRLT